MSASLDKQLQKYFDLGMARSVLGWDESVYMPDEGADGRGRQSALLGSMALDILASKKLGEELEQALESNQITALQRNHYKYALKQHKLALAVPTDFYNEMSLLQSKLFAVWQKAKKAKDFSMIEELLKENVEYSKKYSEFLSKAIPNAKHPMDALIAQSDDGMTFESVNNLFADLKKNLVPIVKVATEKKIDTSCLKINVPIEKQRVFCDWIVEQLGFEKSWGRQDVSVHPFMTRFSKRDIRITTRFLENDFTESIFSSIHETGHAFYEYGLGEELDGTLLSGGASTGVHESQSRLWENLVGRSREFWNFAFPKMKEIFGEHAKNLEFESFLQAINSSKKSLVRTSSDELTYSLHVMIRFHLEAELLTGKLKVKDIPEAWDNAYEEMLGVRSKSLDEGCLQDVHWFCANVGGHFQGYAIGNMMSTQFFDTAVQKIPNLHSQFANGQFLELKNWLHNNIHSFGCQFTPDEIVKNVTGENLSAKSYLKYLSSKFL